MAASIGMKMADLGASSRRQKISWLLLVIYLGATFCFIHYLFDISDQYSQLALDHAKHFRKKDRQLLGLYDMIAEHLFNVPFSWWLVILLVPYISIFLLLITCTRANCVLIGNGENSESGCPESLLAGVCCLSNSNKGVTTPSSSSNSSKQMSGFGSSSQHQSAAGNYPAGYKQHPLSSPFANAKLK